MRKTAPLKISITRLEKVSASVRFICYNNIVRKCLKARQNNAKSGFRFSGFAFARISAKITGRGMAKQTNTKKGAFAVAKPRNPARDKAKNEWLQSGGKTPTKELAQKYGVSEVQIRKWKSADKWQAEFDRKKRGGQKGNKNAAGHGAPKGNTNAETHGAYSTVHLEDLPPEERAYIESMTLDARENMLRELQLLYAKERDLARRIKEYKRANPNALYVDRVIDVFTSKKKDEYDEGDTTTLKQSARTVIQASPFERLMKLEAEYNKIHGRILKLIDTIKAYEIDSKRLDLDERKHELSRQRITGEYNVDPDTGEIDDTPSAESGENDA